MNIRMLIDTGMGNNVLFAGATYDVPEANAQRFIANGRAVETSANEVISHDTEATDSYPEQEE